MKETRINTNKNFGKLLPFSGNALPAPMFNDAGLFHHMTIKLPNGHLAVLCVTENAVRDLPEYFEIV